MPKVLICAAREFRSTAMTKAFLFGVVIFPLVILGGIMAVTALGLFESKRPPLQGVVAVQDTTEDRVVLGGLRTAFAPETQEREAAAERESLRQGIETMPGGEGVSDEKADRALEMAGALAGVGVPARVTIEEIGAGADTEAQKKRVLTGEALALITATPDSLTPGEGSFGMFTGKDIAPEHLEKIRRSVQKSIVDWRFAERGWDPQEVALLQTFPRAESVTVTESGETRSNEDLAMMLPMIFMMLLWISVMTGGQYLLMSTIEEKSSRVMEVLLSAISPGQLLTGKIIGQGFVGLVVLAMYAGLGIAAAWRFGTLSLVPVETLPWLMLYFIMAYFLFASLMAAVGSAVTEIREAQSLMGPIMMLLMFPLILWLPIIQNPNSVFSRVMSFIPPCTPFVMVLRMSQTTDTVPMWEVLATTAVGFAGVAAIGWAAVKIFRIGVLMYGKPPSLLGLVKWVRYA